MIGFAAAGAAIKRVPTWAWAVIGAAVVLVAFYMALNAYGNSRYKAGKADADAAWIEASNKLIDKAAASGKKADTAAAARQADFVAKVEDEKERMDAAVKEGSSPMDVLFGPAAG